MNVVAFPRLFGHDPVDLDRAMYRIVHRQINRDRTRELIREYRRLNSILMTRGIYSYLCQEYEDAAKAAYMDAVEAFHSRNEI